MVEKAKLTIMNEQDELVLYTDASTDAIVSADSRRNRETMYLRFTSLSEDVSN